MTKASGVSKRLPRRNLHVPMPMEQGSGGFAAGASPNLRPGEMQAGCFRDSKTRDASRGARGVAAPR